MRAVFRNHEKIQLNKWDLLLVFGAVLSPMTGLRIWKIGPAEVLCLIWALRYVSMKRLVLDEHARFFILFLIGMFLGTLVCIVVAPEELNTEGWATWIYLAFISCVLLKRIRKNSLEYNIKLFDVICRLCVLWYLFLYGYSLLVGRVFLGAPLWYHNLRYSGGGTNPHQVAVMLCGIAFWFSGRALQGKSFLLNTLFFGITVYLETQTRSSTGLAAIFLASLVLLVIVTVQRVKHKRNRAIIITLEIAAGVLIAVIFYRVIYQMVYEWIADDSNGIGRFYIWSSFRNVLRKSPVFGLGPGEHTLTQLGELQELHNTYLEIYAASGLLGFFAFVILSIRVFRTVARGNLAMLPILISMYMYNFAGFSMRRLVYWVIITFVFVISEQCFATAALDGGRFGSYRNYLR
ncbi:MAG: O-antigen ligase family protein [Clostridia bacterium]|nr:O-antigen ligase family protein [Clostridia bacterium]